MINFIIKFPSLLTAIVSKFKLFIHFDWKISAISLSLQLPYQYVVTFLLNVTYQLWWYSFGNIHHIILYEFFFRFSPRILHQKYPLASVMLFFNLVSLKSNLTSSLRNSLFRVYLFPFINYDDIFWVPLELIVLLQKSVPL